MSAFGSAQPGVRIDVYSNPAAASAACAEEVAAAAERAIGAYGEFVWCLAGGTTPKAAYALLATARFAERVDWRRFQVLFGDERCVPPDDAASNYRMVHQTLLAKTPMPDHRVHRVAGERDPERAAAEYEGVVRELLGVSPQGSPLREIDLLLLGMGEDGHTASLFPGSVDEDAWVSPRRHPVDGSWRVTLTPRVLNFARDAIFLVTGANKAVRLSEVVTGPERPRVLPTQRVRPTGGLRWLVDEAAARVLLGMGRQAALDRRVDLVLHP
jgi:6-phosphogluconolactonase